MSLIESTVLSLVAALCGAVIIFSGLGLVLEISHKCKKQKKS